MKKPVVRRWLVVVASVAVAASLLLPLWQIDIEAPQYPEGLELTIFLGKIGGNLQQINLLNHYIGMKHITPASIPELRIMPFVVVALAGLGLVVAWIGRRWAVAAWLAVLGVAGAAGLVDFYLWSYDYGHNLDPNAPIKVPGMSYQPPLLGHKQLLNIDAYSYPAIGGILVGVAAVLALAALVWVRGERRPRRIGSRRAVATLAPLVSLFIWGLSGCTPRPQPIEVGRDQCAMCQMIVSDARFGGELVMKRGKVHVFDSVDCLLDFYRRDPAAVRSVLLLDYFDAGHLVPAEEARFYLSDEIRAPMGRGIAVTRDGAALEALKSKTRGEELTWKRLVGPSS